LDREITSEADDKSALTVEERQRRTAEVQGDLLDTERQEAELTWKARTTPEQLAAAYKAMNIRDDC
jgi:hypothetical protein